MNGKPDPSATPLWLALAFLAFSALSWAGSSVAGRAASGNIPPFTLSFVRWLCVFLCFLAIGWRDAWRQRDAIFRQWRILSAFALFGVVGFTVPYYVGLQFTVAVNATLMNASGTIWIVATTFLMTGETIRRRQALGVALGLFGTLTIVLRADYAQLAGIAVNAGDLFVLAAFFSWALYTAMLRWRPRGVGGIPFLIAITGIGSAMMLPLYLLDLGRGAVFEPTAVKRRHPRLFGDLPVLPVLHLLEQGRFRRRPERREHGPVHDPGIRNGPCGSDLGRDRGNLSCRRNRNNFRRSVARDGRPPKIGGMTPPATATAPRAELPEVRPRPGKRRPAPR